MKPEQIQHHLDAGHRDVRRRDHADAMTASGRPLVLPLTEPGGRHEPTTGREAVVGEDRGAVAGRLARFVERQRQCKLVQWVLAYIAFAWLALQLTDALREIWSWPLSLPRAITLSLGLGAFPATVIAWYHGERGRQQLCAMEVVLVTGLTAGSLLVIWRVCF